MKTLPHIAYFRTLSLYHLKYLMDIRHSHQSHFHKYLVFPILSFLVILLNDKNIKFPISVCFCYTSDHAIRFSQTLKLDMNLKEHTF